MKCAAVICAAGAGSRMGQNKALCLMGHDTFLTSIVRVLQTMIAPPVSPIVVVTGAQADDVRNAHQNLIGISWVLNPDWETTHMLESLVCGLQIIPSGMNVLQWPVDCIGVQHEDLRLLLNATPAPFTVLSHNGKPGHPMRILAPQADFLRAHPDAYASLKEVFRDYPRQCVEASGAVLNNCNTPQNLADFVASSTQL